MRLLPLVFAAVLLASAAAASEVSEERRVVDPPVAADSGAELPSPDIIVGEADEAAAGAPAEVAGVPVDESSSRTFTDVRGDGRPKGISPVDPPEPYDDG